MRVFVLAVLLAIGLTGFAWGGDPKVIELEDGSILSGEILSLDEGMFQVNSRTLGLLRIKASQVKSISPAKSVNGWHSSETVSSGDLQELLVLMMQDREIMGAILSLREDPDFKKALEDPAIVDAVGRRDLSGLMNNPGFLKLMNHSKVREIINRLEE